MRGLRIEHENALLREATVQRAEFLRKGTEAALGPGTELRVRDLHVLVTVKLPIAAAVPTEAELNDAAELRVGAEQVLTTAGLRPEPLSADRYVRLMSTLLNWGAGAGWRDRIVPECDPQRLIREQLLDLDRALDIDARGLTLGDCRVQTLSVKRFPDRLGFGLAARFLGDPLSGTRGVRHNLLVCLNLHFPDPEATRVQLTAQRQWAANMAYGPMVKFLPALAQRKHGFDVLFEALDNGDRPLKAYLGLVLFTPPAEAVAALSNLRTYWRELGFQVMADHFFALPLFLHCLPFGAEHAVLRDSMRYRTLAATQAVTLMPVFGDWKGTGTPVLNLVARTGQLLEVSLFDTASNYNAVIAAQSGSGKSFLTNELLATNLSVGGRCWVIDVGRSYENLCASLQGQFVAFTREATLCLNPFALIRNRLPALSQVRGRGRDRHPVPQRPLQQPHRPGDRREQRQHLPAGPAEPGHRAAAGRAAPACLTEGRGGASEKRAHPPRRLLRDHGPDRPRRRHRAPGGGPLPPAPLLHRPQGRGGATKAARARALGGGGHPHPAGGARSCGLRPKPLRRPGRLPACAPLCG